MEQKRLWEVHEGRVKRIKNINTHRNIIDENSMVYENWQESMNIRLIFFKKDDSL